MSTEETMDTTTTTTTENTVDDSKPVEQEETKRARVEGETEETSTEKKDEAETVNSDDMKQLLEKGILSVETVRDETLKLIGVKTEDSAETTATTEQAPAEPPVTPVEDEKKSTETEAAPEPKPEGETPVAAATAEEKKETPPADSPIASQVIDSA